MSPPEVRLTVVQPILLAAARQRTTFKRISQEIGPLLEGPWALIRAQPGLRSEGQHNIAMYWDKAGDGSIEVGVQVTAPFEPTEAVVCSKMPAGPAATATHTGGYFDLGKTHDAVIAWCRQHDYALAGPFWEVYGDWTQDSAKLTTEVFHLLA